MKKISEFIKEALFVVLIGTNIGCGIGLLSMSYHRVDTIGLFVAIWNIVVAYWLLCIYRRKYIQRYHEKNIKKDVDNDDTFF